MSVFFVCIWEVWYNGVRQVDEVESIGRYKHDSYAANVQLPIYLAKAAKNVKLICFSSDQVYTGVDEEGPYLEDMAKPGNIYASHKLEIVRKQKNMA